MYGEEWSRRDGQCSETVAVTVRVGPAYNICRQQLGDSWCRASVQVLEVK